MSPRRSNTLTPVRSGEAAAAAPQDAMMGFGPHLMMDCKGCNVEKLADVGYIFNVLNTLPERIGMTKITQPYVFPYSGLVPEDKGVTGIVIIAESHLSFHSFVEKDYFFFDLFSCKPFDVAAARAFIMEAFEVREAEVHYVERGLDFPRSEALGGPASPVASTLGVSPDTPSREAPRAVAHRHAATESLAALGTPV